MYTKSHYIIQVQYEHVCGPQARTTPERMDLNAAVRQMISLEAYYSYLTCNLPRRRTRAAMGQHQKKGSDWDRAGHWRVYRARK